MSKPRRIDSTEKMMQRLRSDIEMLKRKVRNAAAGSPPTGPAGGDLSGTFPNPTIGNLKVTTGKINSSAVTAQKLDDNAVITSKIANNSINAAKIIDGQVGTLELATSAVTAAKINDGSVVTSKLNAGAVTNDKISNGAVNDAKITGPISDSKLTSNIPKKNAVNIFLEQNQFFAESSSPNIYSDNSGVGTGIFGRSSSGVGVAGRSAGVGGGAGFAGGAKKNAIAAFAIDSTYHEVGIPAFDANNERIAKVGFPSSGTDAINRNFATAAYASAIHSARHKLGGADEIKLHELGLPTSDVAMNSRKLTGLQQGSAAGHSAEYSQMIAGDVAAQMGFTLKSAVNAVSIKALAAHSRVGDVLTATNNGFLADSFGSLKFSWESGTVGTGDGQFNQSYDIALDSSGNIFVLDRNNNRVQKFDSSGVYQSKFGSAGTGNGQFTNAAGIAIDSTNRIYVIDQTRVQRFTSAGAYSATVITIPSGSGFLTDSQYGGYGLHIDSSNNIYISYIEKFYSTPDFEQHKISKYNSSAALQWTIGGDKSSSNGYFNNPSSIATDSSLNVFVADSGNHRVQKFNSSGSYQSQFGVVGSNSGQFKAPNGIEVDSSGNIWVSDYFNARVQKFNSSGSYQEEFGGTGQGNGQFLGPRGIVVTSSGDLIVADSLNNRIQRFTAFTLSANDSVLVRHEGSGTHIENNVYTVTNPGSAGTKWVLTLRPDLSTGYISNQILVVSLTENGVQNRMFVLNTPDPITVWTTPLTWNRFEPGGPPSPHASNHASGGTDPLPDRSISPSMLNLSPKIAVTSANVNINSGTWSNITGLQLSLEAGLYLITYDLDTSFTDGSIFGVCLVDNSSNFYTGLKYTGGHNALERDPLNFAGFLQLSTASIMNVKAYRVSGSGVMVVNAPVTNLGNTQFTAVRIA